MSTEGGDKESGTASVPKKLKSEEPPHAVEMNEEVKQAFANAWNQLDYHDEKQHIKETHEYGDIDAIAKQELEQYVQKHNPLMKKSSSKEKRLALSSSKSTDAYDGPKVFDDTVINEGFINSLIAFFAKWGLDKKMPAKYVWKMVELATPVLEKEPSIVGIRDQER